MFNAVKQLAIVLVFAAFIQAQTSHTFAALDQSNQFTAPQLMTGLTVNGAGPPEWTMPDTSSCPIPLSGTWGECSLNGVPHIFALGSDQGAIVTAGAIGSPNGLAGLNGSGLVPCTQLGTGIPGCNDTTKFLNSTGTYTTPAGSGSTFTASGNTTVVCTVTGTLTNGNLVKFDANGNCVDSGIAAASSVLFFSTGGSNVSPSTQGYIGLANETVSVNEQLVEVPVPKAGTISNLQCRYGVALTGSMQQAFVVRKLAFSASIVTLASTSLACNINSTNPVACNDTNAAHNFTVAAGDMIDIQATPSNTPTGSEVACSMLLQ